MSNKKNSTFRAHTALLFCAAFSTAIFSSACLQTDNLGPVYSVEKIADGFMFTEGPVWVPGKGLLFSDIPANKVYLYSETDGVRPYLQTSGNSNGLALNSKGELLLAQHGLRQVSRLEGSKFVPLAVSFNGKKLNSPNDLAVHSRGSVFFTDPPFGLMDNGLKSELGFSGIYRIDPDGEIVLLDKDLELPNGLALNEDESILYADDSQKRIIYRWDVETDLTISNKQVFAKIPMSGYADGMKTDSSGNLYVTGPGGVWIYSSEGSLITRVAIPGQTTASNCAWGDEDGKSLYVTSNNAVYRIRRTESLKQ